MPSAKLSNQTHGTGASGYFGQLLVLLCLAGFSITEPMLTIFGANPSIFISYNVETSSPIRLYAFIVALLPAISLWILSVGAGFLSRRAGVTMHYVFVGVLSGLWFLQLAKWSLGVERPAILATFGFLGGCFFTFIYAKWLAVGTVLKIAAIGPLIMVVIFLSSSSTSKLMHQVATQEERTSSVESMPSVLFILLDEISTMALFDEGELVDKVRFPNLAKLVDEATWYRHYSVMSGATVISVPSILTGNDPKPNAPIAANHPNNLFSALGPTHHLTVFEAITGLCSLPQCSESAPGAPVEQPTQRLDLLLSKTLSIWLARVSIARVGDFSFDDFEEKFTVDEKSLEEALAHTMDLHYGAGAVEFAKAKPERFKKFIGTFEKNEEPALHFIHLLLPHMPWRFYGNGQPYDMPIKRLAFSADNSDGDEWLAKLTEYRSLMQAEYTDGLLGEFFSRLKTMGLWDDLLVVVTADHGRSSEPQTMSRMIMPETIDSIAYAPLFIKRPGQKLGGIDDSNVMAYDIVPTITDILGVELPWAVRGSPAGSAEIAERGDQKVYFPKRNRLQKYIFALHLAGETTFSDRENFPSFSTRLVGPYAESENSLISLNRSLQLERYLDQPVANFEAKPGGNAVVDDLPLLRNPPTDKAPLGVVMGNFESDPVGDRVLISVNGRFVTGSPLVEFKGIKNTFIAMLPSGVLMTENEIGVYSVEKTELLKLDIH